MKKLLVLMLMLCLLLTGCSSAEGKTETYNDAADNVEQAEPAVVIHPLPDTTMDDLNDAILSVSLEEGDAYVDDTGIMQMDLKIYSYDKYDMVDIADLKVGDVLVRNGEEVELLSVERQGNGTIAINGGLEQNGFDLVTDECGIYFERGYNDSKNWHEVGEATIRVSVDFVYHDYSDMDLGEVVYYPGSFLVGEVTDYYFFPSNTTVRVENGQIIEMQRVYIP